MTAPTSTTRLGIRDRKALASPIALAFVQTVVARRGVTEAQARQVYLDYINRSRPAARPRASESRAMT
jgi:hypothetical protein